MNEKQAIIFDIKRGSSEDGPGIRSTVFFKGCPLSCVWCQNPEGLKHEPETDRNGEPVGEHISLDELLYRVRQDKPFYDSSGGGVTLSGGEPTQQMKFNHHFLKALKAEGIQTAIETCGLFNYPQFKNKLLPWLDIIYFDFKLFDPQQSKQYTGCTNTHILKNFSRLIEDAQIPVVPRVPLIPNITASEENLSAIANFLKSKNINDGCLMPYNPLWIDKLKRLGKQSNYQHNTYMTTEELDASMRCFQHN